MKKSAALVLTIAFVVMSFHATLTFAQRRRNHSRTRNTNQTTRTKPVVKQCSLDMAHSPILRGLILGMSFGDVARMFPGIEMKNNPDGYSVLNLEFVAGLGVTGHDRAMEGNYIGGYHVNRSLREGFADVDKLEIHFLDEKAILIDVTYSGGERWTDIGDFAEASAKGLEITATWVPTNGTRLTHNGEESYPDSVSAGIQCEGFSVVALLDSINRPHLQLRADQNIATFLQRLRDRRQRQRDSFKP